MTRNDKEYEETRRPIAAEEAFLARQCAALQELGLSPEEVERAMQPALSFHAQLVEEVEWYERVRRRDFDHRRRRGTSQWEARGIMDRSEEILIERLKERCGDARHATDTGGAAVFPPMSREAVDRAEHALGFSVPGLLRGIYTVVGNGEFGPGYGLIGLDGGALLDTGDSVVTLYQSFQLPDPDDPLWAWPRGLLAICHWGCAIYSCVDCLDNSAPIVRFDPNGHLHGRPWETAFRPEAVSLRAWLQAWLDGRLSFEPSFTV